MMLKQINDRLYRIERTFVAWATAAMGLVVFLDVMHRTASRDDGYVKTIVVLLLLAPFVFGALRMRGETNTAKAAGLTALILAATFGALRLFLELVPNGLVWSQTLGLVMMLWVGCFGASMATHESRHLALDLGSKLWPKSALPYVQGIGNLVTAAFCIMLAFLAVYSLRSHYGDYLDTDGAGGTFVAIAIPKFMAFTIIPAGFGLMGLRFTAQALQNFAGSVDEEDTLQMLGMAESNPDGTAGQVKP